MLLILNVFVMLNVLINWKMVEYDLYEEYRDINARCLSNLRCPECGCDAFVLIILMEFVSAIEYIL